MRIHVYELKIGMFVSELDIPWEQSPFLIQGFDIKSHEDIQTIQNICNFVEIDASRQKTVHGAISSNLEKSFLRSFEDSAKTYQKTSSLVKNMMDDIRFGNQLNGKTAKVAVSECVDQVLESPDTMLLLTQLKNQDEYTSQHSLNVCILSILLARHLKYPIEEINQIGLCGLLHDMGKMKIPTEILNKPGKLTVREEKIMRSHTTKGRDIIMSARDVYPGAVDVAYTHHEKLDGTGYPRGLGAFGISTHARIVAIVDAYDAITSDRIYQKGRLHLQAINILMLGRNKHFDDSLVLKFVDCIGIYPVGNTVEMKNGEVGIVTEINKTNKTRPKVLMVMDSSKQLMKNSFAIDLATNPSDLDGKPYRIYKVLRKNEYNFDLFEFNQRGDFKKALQNKNF